MGSLLRWESYMAPSLTSLRVLKVETPPTHVMLRCVEEELNTPVDMRERLKIKKKYFLTNKNMVGVVCGDYWIGVENDMWYGKK